MKTTPDHHDAELVLRVYDMRREATMRASRHAIMREFWPKSIEDVRAVTANPESPLNAPFRQVGTYWEMVYGIVRHGIVNAEYFLESNAEGFFLLAKMEPFVDAYRADTSPRSFRNAQWVATECPPGREIYEGVKARVRKMAEARDAKR